MLGNGVYPTRLFLFISSSLVCHDDDDDEEEEEEEDATITHNTIVGQGCRPSGMMVSNSGVRQKMVPSRVSQILELPFVNVKGQESSAHSPFGLRGVRAIMLNSTATKTNTLADQSRTSRNDSRHKTSTLVV